MKSSTRIAKRNLEGSIAANGNFPKCYDSKVQYKEWLAQEAVANTVAFRKNICEDCCLGFKSMMVKSHRCAVIQAVLKE